MQYDEEYLWYVGEYRQHNYIACVLKENSSLNK